MTSPSQINVRATLRVLELSGLCAEKFGFIASASKAEKQVALLAICRETWVSPVTQAQRALNR